MEEMEVGREETIQLDQDRGTSGEKAEVAGAAVGLPLEEEKSLQDLEKAVHNLKMDVDIDKKSSLVVKLGAAREDWIAEKRRAARVAWREESVKEVRERAAFQERMVFLLPEEWEAVLAQVKDPRDKQVMSDMSLAWRAETKRDRTRYLFPTVFQILNENYNSTQADMMECRLSCQEWRDSIDSYFQNLLSCPKIGQTMLLRTNLRKDWETVVRFGEWSTQAYGTGGNSFPTRKLLIGDPTLSEPEVTWQTNSRFWSEIGNMLQDWGSEIWEVFIWFDPGINVGTLYLNLQRFLGLMPNLKYLCLVYNDTPESRMCRVRSCPKNPADDDAYICSAEDAIKKRMAEEYLPEMPQLKVLDFCFVPPTTINGMLIKYGLTLETLRVNETLSNPYEYGGGTTLPRLQKFFLTAAFFRDDEPEDCPKMNWPALEEISLMYFNLEAAYVPQVFAIANDFERTLQKLTLVLHKKDGPLGKLDQSQLKNLRLDLPRVEKFSLSVRRLNLKGVDFILPMAALKELSVTYIKVVSSFDKKEQKGGEKPGPALNSSSSGVNQEEIIQFSDYISRLYESNIWSLFPDLRMVTIRVVSKLKETREEDEDGRQIKQKIYTREGYKQHLASAHCSGENGGCGGDVISG